MDLTPDVTALAIAGDIAAADDTAECDSAIRTVALLGPRDNNPDAAAAAEPEPAALATLGLVAAVHGLRGDAAALAAETEAMLREVAALHRRCIFAAVPR